MVIDNWAESISHYDSYYDDDRDRVCQRVLRYLQEEHLERKGRPLHKKYFLYPHASRERQRNNYDCGVYVCKVGRSFLDHAWRRLTPNEIRQAILGEVTQIRVSHKVTATKLKK